MCDVARYYCLGTRKEPATLPASERDSLNLAMRAARLAFVRDWTPRASPTLDHQLRDLLGRSGAGYEIYRMDTPEIARGLLGRRATPKPVLQFMDEDASDRAKALVAKSPSLQADLRTLDEGGWSVRYGEPGHGSFASRERKLITLDGNFQVQHTAFVQALSHEVGHAVYPYERDVSSKAASANGGWDIGVAGNNHAAYNAAYDAFLRTGDAAACRQAIGAVVGNEIASTTGQTYSQYYGGWYDEAFPSR